MSPAKTDCDPGALLAALDPEVIVARLQELDREARALRVLLRAVRARQRGGPPHTMREREAPHE